VSVDERFGAQNGPRLCRNPLISCCSTRERLPENLYLKASGSDKRILSGTIYIDDREDSLVEIASVQASREGIQCTYTRAPLARHQIEVCFNEATKQEIKFPQEIRITTKNPVREDMVVKIYCKPSSTLGP
jgi:hypothetical protein